MECLGDGGPSVAVELETRAWEVGVQCRICGESFSLLERVEPGTIHRSTYKVPKEAAQTSFQIQHRYQWASEVGSEYDGGKVIRTLRLESS